MSESNKSVLQTYWRFGFPAQDAIVHTMKSYLPSRSPCAVGRASRILGDRWVMLILREAFLGVAHFEDFMARLDISRASLSSRLGWLVDAGILTREPADARRAAYHLTPAGRALQPTYDAIKAWGEAWLPRPGADAP